MTTLRSRRSRSRPDLDVGFRLLDNANGHNFYLGVPGYEIPQPPRAPEPFKIAAASSTMSRAHRRSSFVIIAEAEQQTQKLPIDSPSHGIRGRSQSPSSPSRTNRGRASPFRPRGFKGPPPHAQSRPPSPPPPRPANRRRFVKPKSLSQGNSPRKQSLIPQPRGGQITMRNDNEKRVQGRWERRGSRKLNHTRIPRSSSLKIPQPAPRPSIESTNRLIKKPIVIKKPLKSVIKSPTKIPIRNSSNGLNKRFIQVPTEEKTKKTMKMEEETIEMKEKKDKQVTNPISQSMTDNLSPLVTNESAIMTDQSSPTDKQNNKSEKTENDFGLVDLLKQSSGASGTSSVVNAATTTAVQPLRIDAATILPQEVLETKDAKLNPSNQAAKLVSRNSENQLSQKINNNFAGQTVATVADVEASQEVEAIVEVPPKDEVKEDKDKPPKTNALEIVSVSTVEPARINAGEPRSNVSNSVLHHDLSRTSPNSNESTSIVKDKLQFHDSENSLKSSKSNELSTGSVESIKSNDTGVSLNTVRGIQSVSSAKEERGTHIVNRVDEIETLSSNVINLENQENAQPSVVEAAEPATLEARSQQTHEKPMTRLGRFHQWRNSILSRYRDRLRNMKCLNCRRKKVQHQQTEVQRPTTERQLPVVQSTCSRFKAAFCRSFRWSSKIAPTDSTGCCRKEGGCTSFLCKKRDFCRWPGCCVSCCRCSCCGQSGGRSDQRSRSIRAKHSLTSVAPPPISEEQKSKIPDVLIEHNSVMRGAIPCLPVSLAWFCLVWNIILPGSGTVWSGFFNLCVGQPRFAATTSAKGRIGAFIVNLIVGISQLFTVLFCLVGWGWSIWWGITMLRLARKWKRFKASEAANGDPEARAGEGGVLPAPGVPTQALRGIERAR